MTTTNFVDTMEAIYKTEQIVFLKGETQHSLRERDNNDSRLIYNGDLVEVVR